MNRMTNKSAKSILLLVLSLLVLLPPCGQTAQADGGDIRPHALYIPMRDGTKIAVDVWLPENFPAGQKIPTLVQATRYWRAQDMVSRDIRADANLGAAGVCNGAGYALVLVDARGTGASFGHRAYELTEDEVKDYGQVADWIAGQPWSDGRIGTFGVSYVGNTAEMIVVNRRPSVRAAAPLFNDFNTLDHLVYPGGVLLDFYLGQWGTMVGAMDRNDICALVGAQGPKCEEVKKQVRGVKPVDGDTDGRLLAEAVAQHRANVRMDEAIKSYEFRDDPFGPERLTDMPARTNPSGHLKEIAAAGTPLFIRVGWLDAATVNGALSRFLSLPNPQTVIIGPWSHGGRNDTDPFLPANTPVQPKPAEQMKEMLAFFDSRLKSGSSPAPAPQSSIKYYTMGAGTWSETKTWPPEGFTATKFYFGPAGSLSTAAPAADAGSDTYTVDPTATTGIANRWHTNIGGGDVVYPDRAAEDKKLLTYTSAPLEADTEITGHPVVTLYASSSADDGAFFAYLEDVAPDGRVTYITEGQLRGRDRLVSKEKPPYAMFGPYRTFTRKDARALVPGNVEDLTFDLWATSVLIKTGHRIRIAVAGADKDNFALYPLGQKKPPTIRVERGGRFASKIVLPLRTK
jgi:putative CocE/NonD family hydrolase